MKREGIISLIFVAGMIVFGAAIKTPLPKLVTDEKWQPALADFRDSEKTDASLLIIF